MIQTGLNSRVKIQEVIRNQLPEFILDESPKLEDFLKQYYISQEFQGGAVDIAENLDQYLKLNNLTSEVIVGSIGLSTNISSSSGIVTVTSTKGFPPKYGLLKIDDEIITYTGITTNSFTGCIRGFSGITDYHDSLNSEELVFSQSSASSHSSGSTVKNLSSLFLQEFYKKLKYFLTPGLENLDFIGDLNVGNFIKEARSLYESKGTGESFRILFNILFGETPSVIDLEKFLIKPSSSEYSRREIIVVETISGNPTLLSGQSIFKYNEISTSASVSEVETITRSGKTYHKLFLFLGYDDTYPTITGTFNITPSTKNLDKISVGSSVISVDSTIGFPNSGKIYSKNNEILYTNKSVNQFFGCSGVKNEIPIRSTIRSDEVYYGYENGDLSKKVEFRITGVISNLSIDDKDFNFVENDEIYPLNLGEKILNPETNKSKKEIFANSWIYNTSTRHQIESFSGNELILKSSIDKSNIKVGDSIEILIRGTDQPLVGYENVSVLSVNNQDINESLRNRILQTDVQLSFSSNNYDIRRKIKKANSSIVPIEFGNNSVISDVLNVYDENSEYLYIASNSFPSYTINSNIFKYNVFKIDLDSYQQETENYSILEFSSEVSFITGDKVYYDFSNLPIVGLERGPYFVEVLSGNKKIKLYSSSSSIGTNSFTSFGKFSETIPLGTHTITLYSQKNNKISPQNILKKIKIYPNIGDSNSNHTVPGPVGILKNGVEIYNYKTTDKVYYGPLESVLVLNGGSNYDVISPPLLEPSFGNALLQPVVVGSVEKVYVDPQDFDLDKIISINLTGGNGQGAKFLPIIQKNKREIEFDARSLTNGGGLDYTDETITFFTAHNLIDGQKIQYDSNNFPEIGIGTFKQSNENQSKTLKNGASYYIKTINNKTIQLYPTLSDYSSGINTVGFTTFGNSGIQKFATEIKNTLTGIEVINGGNGYANRLLRVKSSGISTYNHTISFNNHGFNDGELIVYSPDNFFSSRNPIPSGWVAVNWVTWSDLMNEYAIYPSDTLPLSGVNHTVYWDIEVVNEGNYTLKLQADNSSTLFIDGIQVASSSNYAPGGETNVIVTLNKGYHQISGVVYNTPNSEIDWNGNPAGIAWTLEYEPESVISNLSRSNQYYVLKVDSNSFRLCDAGIGGTNRSNYERKNYVKFGTKGSGSGYQVFSYPKITLDVKYSLVGVGSTGISNNISAIPIIRGKISQVYVYENGNNYGSNIINVHQRPSILVKNGTNAQLFPIISNGKIINVKIQYGGENYFSTPDLIVKGNGSGALLRPVLNDNKIVSVIIINSGSGYSENGTSIIVENSGKNAVFQSNVRSLNLNISYKYGTQGPFYRDPASEILVETNNNLGYFIAGYSENIKNNIGDDGFIQLDDNEVVINSKHSPIIGWSYDGNPIYGPYGYSDPNNNNSPIKKINSSYTQKNITNRPDVSLFPYGSFIEDYEYSESGDLDEFNGRFTKTPEFPNGVYAYFATVDTNASGSIIGKFPYFIGNKYRSSILDENLLLNQNFDFNNSSLIRNTLPYKVDDLFSDYDFLVESNEIIDQKTIIESVTSGYVDDIKIINFGNDYSIGDNLIFDDSETGGGGISASVSELKGKNIVDIKSSLNAYSNSLIIWENGEKIKIYVSPYHEFLNKDNVIISGLTTESTDLNGTYQIEVDSHIAGVANTIPSYSVTGSVFDMYLTTIPQNISIGSSIKINDEIFSILNLYPNYGVVRVSRSPNGTSHSQSSPVYYLPDYFTVNKKTNYFESKKNNKIYFNPSQSIGIGTTAGLGSYENYSIGITTYKIFIPSQSIFLPNHSFINGEEAILKKISGVGITVYDEYTNSNFTILNENTEKVYVIKKSKDFIGIVTNVGLTTVSSGLFFPFSGPNNYFYSIETNYKQIYADSTRVNALVSVSTSHNLRNGDLVSISLNPNISVGIGTSTSIFVKFDPDTQSLLIDPISISPSGINTSLNSISILSHNFKTGDKVLYQSYGSIAVGLNTGFYFVYKIDKNKISLCETYSDCFEDPPTVVDIRGTGSSTQTLSLINPQIPIIKNNNLVFNLSDPSLTGYKFKIYYDKNFTKEFISDGFENNFSIIGFGTVGVTSEASLTLNFSEKTPEKLYYNIEKSGFICTSDTEVINNSEIISFNSNYNGTYFVNGIGSTNFTVSLKSIPEKFSYTQSECDNLEYTTKSNTEFGGVAKLKLSSGGSGYKKLPIFIGTGSTTGLGLFAIPISKTIGKIKKERIINEGFEYLVDKTLRPSASIPKSISIFSANSIESILVVGGGKDYTSPPDLICIDSDTGNVIDSGFIKPKLVGSSIQSVTIETPPKGLPTKPVTIRAINNSNGISINKVEYSSLGIVTCILTTPILGFTTSPFFVGEKIFVEGIQKNDNNGEGFNSSDHGYQFFTVKNYFNLNPAILEYDISKYTKNPGIAKTLQESYANIIKFNNYPQFEVKQIFSPFFIGEKLLSNNGNGFILRDLTVTDSNTNFVRVVGSYNLSENEKIRGVQSLVEATINDQQSTKGRYNISYSNIQNIGWKNNFGKLNDDFQVIPNNDYYQNLSYSIKSTKTWDEIVTPVNNILHPSGLKNFSDSQIENSFLSGIETGSSSISLINDYISENRVDSINNFDLVLDIDTFADKSKFLKFKNVKLTDYILCKTNRVLEIDDISSSFSSIEDERSSTSNILNLNTVNGYNRFLIQTRDIVTDQIQFDEIVIMNNDNDIYTLKKGRVSTAKTDYFSFDNKKSSLAEIEGYVNEDLNFYLSFDPYDALNSNYDIKILQSTFNNFNVGISTVKKIGFIDLINDNKIVASGITTTIVSVNSLQYSSLYSNIHIATSDNSDMNYVEIYVSHDGSNTYIAENYFDGGINESSFGFIGSFGASISPNGILSLNYTNTSIQNIKIRSKTVGFGSTSLGEGIHRFIISGQIAGNEKTAIYTSNYTNFIGSGSTSVISLDKNTFSSVKSLVRISTGNTSAIHQVMTVYDKIDTYSLQYPFLSIGSTNGIGTFGSEISGEKFILKFYPNQYVSEKLEISSFNESFYREQDLINEPPSLSYGTVVDSLKNSYFYGLNSIFNEKLDFQLNYNNVSIFSKTFNPSDASILDLSTGKFTIPNHFFSTGEELIYTPKSTFTGIGSSPMGIGETSNYLGIVTDILPNKLWAIKDSNDVFRLSTKPEYAFQGIGVTFTSVGVGNAHEIEMYKKNEKTLITIDNIAQYPITYTSIKHTLSQNGGQINEDKTIFALSGISSISLNDILEIDNEYMKVENVGVGTTNVGPISFIGDIPLVKVKRGFLGSISGIHTDTSLVRIYRGSYNIVGNEIFFTEAPRGNSLDFIEPEPSNLPRIRSSFNGRVFLRKNYETNRLYDDISTEFTGKKQTFTLTTRGINTTGIGTSGGNGIVFINNIFQTPTTLNNSSNNYFITEPVGLTSITFTGITSSDGSVYTSPFDVNQNQLPRGGIIVSLGSSSGLGYAPLVGASVTAVIGVGGSIVSIGIGTTSGSFGSGYRDPVSVAVTESNHVGMAATVKAIVGAGGTLSFTIIGGGTGYINPTINVSPPSYENLPVIGVSRLGIGTTTDTGQGLLLNVEVGASSTSVGIGSTLFQVTSFKITRPGYGFQIGDVFTPVGLVTARGFSSPPEQFRLTVLETFNDSFCAWQFGEIDYIDSIKLYQDGVRTRFPLYYNNELLSFELDQSDADSQLINFSSLLIIFINGVLQKSGDAYQFTGGTSFTFSVPPKPNDKVDIFFYRGTRDEDSQLIETDETIKIGDDLQVFSNNNFIENTITQNSRIVYEIVGSDRIETNLYIDQGIDTNIEKPVYWTKQKSDLIIKEQFVSKSRNSIEPQIYPTANIIKDFNSSSPEIFVDSIELFNYENQNPIKFDAFIANQIADPISAKVNAVVSLSGTISSLEIIDGGSGYTGSTIPLIISSPRLIKNQNGENISERASAYATVSTSGTVTSPIIITNPGFGYTNSSPPQVLVSTNNTKYEIIKNITTIQGFESSIVGIATTVGIGVPLAIKFTISPSPASLLVGYPIYVLNTNVGNGVTSINTGDNDIVSISTSFLNNIYHVNAYTPSLGILTCNILSTTSTIGIATTGIINYPVGKLSWGKLSGFSRSPSPISIGVSGYTSSIGITTFSYNSGLSTYPIIQRRGYGLRNIGALNLRINQIL